MPSIKTLLVVVVCLGSATRVTYAEDVPGSGTGVPVSRLSGRVVDRKNGGPVEGALVQITDGSGRELTAVTDRAGRYAFELIPGEYDVTFIAGDSRTLENISITADRDQVLDSKVDSATGEVITVLERRPPKVLPKPTNYANRRNPPYSQEALDQDAWTRAWLMLDVSPTGEVVRFKFLKRPGYHLEQIAADEVFRLKFTPGRNDQGQAVRTWMVWLLEWPSVGWLDAMQLPRTAKPKVTGFPPRLLSDFVPCKGSGAIDLDVTYPTFRDCSKPDMSRMEYEPWVARP
jgi:Carboxypeptidase regulatory-like domain